MLVLLDISFRTIMPLQMLFLPRMSIQYIIIFHLFGANFIILSFQSTVIPIRKLLLIVNVNEDDTPNLFFELKMILYRDVLGGLEPQLTFDLSNSVTNTLIRMLYFNGQLLLCWNVDA